MRDPYQFSPSELRMEMVYNLMFNAGEIPYNEISTFNKEFSLPSERNQEKEYIKKESFEKLSEEAKAVINIVINSPSEILEKFKTKKYNLYSKDLLKNYLREKFRWKKPKMDRVFTELTLYTRQLGQ